MLAAPNAPGSKQLPGASSPADRLGRLAQIADELGDESIAAAVQRLQARIAEGRFFVACVGQFKRGKSTLLNALVAEAILPTGVVPVTTVPTVLRYGNERTARILIGAKWHTIRPQDLADYVSEERNSQNRKRVEGVEVFLPSALLASGMCFVDTPGVGSVFGANSDATREFIPQIDAAILVIGADPPISGEELALVEAVAANVDRILIVLNKVDRVSPTERQEASNFAKEILEAKISRPFGRIYEVSALNSLNHCAAPDGWNELADDLRQLASHSGTSMTGDAAERGRRRFSASLLHAVGEHIRALEQPIAESEQRIANLRQTVVQAEQWLRDLGALFSAEQLQLSNFLLARRKEFLKQTAPVARDQLTVDLRASNKGFGPARRREHMAIAQSIARRHVMPWLDAEETHAATLYAEVTQRFVKLVNDLLLRLSQEHVAEFSGLPGFLDSEAGFRTRSRFYFHDMVTVAQPASPLVYLGDALLGALRFRHYFDRQAAKFLEELLDVNAARVQSDVEQRVVESRLRLEADVRRLLREVSTSAEHALSKARELATAGTIAVQKELERLQSLQNELDLIGT